MCGPAAGRRPLPNTRFKLSRQWVGEASRMASLLQRARTQFDVFLTTDQNLQFEQNVQGLTIAIVVLCRKSNRLADLRPLIPKVLSKIQFSSPGTITKIFD